MELKRRKTFIKSSLQLSHEKSQPLITTAQTREDAGFWPNLLDGQQKSHNEKAFLASPQIQEYDRFSKKGAQLGPKKRPTGLYETTFKMEQKIKTYDCVLGANTAATISGPLIGSASFPGPSSRLVSASNCSGQDMIDYRHFVPQTPFVPAVAKSIPRKRISLKHPKKCFRNLLHLCRNKTESLAFLATKGKALSLPEDSPEAEQRLRTAIFHLGESPGPDSLFQDLSDGELPSDSSFDLCRALCEDVASLKSFDSLTGCGEIFADESSVPCLELNEGSKSAPQKPQSFQNKQCALVDLWLEMPQEPNTGQPRLDAAQLAQLPLCPCRNLHSDSKVSSTDIGTPKSEQPESVSTSDEGYYDSFSPGLEDDKEVTLSLGIPVATFLQDSYSGDALYEFFNNPSEGLVSPALNEGLCVSASVSGSAMDTPVSICSFHVGAEENLAPSPAPDILGQGFLQSSWKGKECLLKLCDTELSITMGIVNWLRRSGPEFRAPSAPSSGCSSVPLGLQGTLRGLAEKLNGSSEEAGPCAKNVEGNGRQLSDIGRAAVCTEPTGKEPWTPLETEGLPTRQNKAPGMQQEWGAHRMSRATSLEHLQVSAEEDLFSPIASVLTMAANTSSKNKISDLPTWTGSEKGLSPAMNLGYLQGPWTLDTLEQEPSLMDCVAKVEALHFHQDS
ncbi:PREDICTED: APC membrane recruitment protein 3-like [Elephantulus edwardii]|uniref:APC membrane recruitment protein 3-like n=1 Tax=Elephantulus edwardii TaxID=28737 RepID=UPI0003F08BB1|nr:PREDICTED: APC membrane recruitment protein 3-like [Elephantulus edwardii]